MRAELIRGDEGPDQPQNKRYREEDIPKGDEVVERVVKLFEYID